MKVTVRDMGIPIKSVSATIDVRIMRDNSTLSFTSSTYNAKITENKNRGEQVIAVTAAPGVRMHKWLYAVERHLEDVVWIFKTFDSY